VPFGPYIADFCCVEVKLIIEVDGDTHIGRETYDEGRTNGLAGLGYKAIRVTNNDVESNIEVF